MPCQQWVMSADEATEIIAPTFLMTSPAGSRIDVR